MEVHEPGFTDFYYVKIAHLLFNFPYEYPSQVSNTFLFTY